MAEVQSMPQPAHFLSQTPTKPIPLQRTDYGNHIDPSTVSWLQPSSKDMSLEDMRARYHQDGYLWLKNVIPRSDVYDMREAYFRVLEPTGILAPGTSPREGLFNRGVDPMLHQGTGATPHQSAELMLDAIHTAPEYNTFLEHPELRRWVRQLMGWEKEVILKRGLIRHHVPGSRCPSGIHYDQLFLRAGDPVFVSAWVPIGDCAADGGGLMYLENSAPLGRTVEERFMEMQEKDDMSREERVSAFNRHMTQSGHLSHNAEEWAKGEGKGRRWLVADYEAGDIVFHSPWMIHASGQNDDKSGRIRLATDLRFYEEGAKLDQRWMRPWSHDDGL